MRVVMSHSARSAWIEISKYYRLGGAKEQSHSARSAWIEISRNTAEFMVSRSHSARSAWIEIMALRR